MTIVLPPAGLLNSTSLRPECLFSVVTRFYCNAESTNCFRVSIALQSTRRADQSIPPRSPAIPVLATSPTTSILDGSTSNRNSDRSSQAIQAIKNNSESRDPSDRPYEVPRSTTGTHQRKRMLRFLDTNLSSREVIPRKGVQDSKKPESEARSVDEYACEDCGPYYVRNSANHVNLNPGRCQNNRKKH